MERLVYNLFLLYFVNKIVIFLLLFRWYNVVEREEIIMSVLKLENVKKYYGVKNNITKAVDGISFQVDEGEFVAIMGASGSGKTTLLYRQLIMLLQDISMLVERILQKLKKMIWRIFEERI